MANFIGRKEIFVERCFLVHFKWIGMCQCPLDLVETTKCDLFRIFFYLFHSLCYGADVATLTSDIERGWMLRREIGGQQ